MTSQLKIQPPGLWNTAHDCCNLSISSGDQDYHFRYIDSNLMTVSRQHSCRLYSDSKGCETRVIVLGRNPRPLFDATLYGRPEGQALVLRCRRQTLPLRDSLVESLHGELTVRDGLVGFCVRQRASCCANFPNCKLY